MEAQELQDLLQSLLAEQAAKHPPLAPPAELQETIAAPEPMAVPEQLDATETIAAPEPMAVPEQLDAAETIAAPEPLAVPEQLDAAETIAAPESDAPAKPLRSRFAQIRDALYEMLDAEMEEPALSDTISTTEPVAATASKAQRRSMGIGVVLVALALVGATTLARGGVRLLQRALSNDQREQELVAVVTPLVIMDMPAFASVEELSDDQLLTAAIWSLVIRQQLHTYPEQMGMCTVPAADLHAEVYRLFAIDRPLIDHTLQFGGDLRCYYDADSKSFYLPISPKTFTYVPDVLELTPANDATDATEGYFIDVAYRAEQPAWLSTTPEIIKTVRFLLTNQNNQWLISSATLL